MQGDGRNARRLTEDNGDCPSYSVRAQKIAYQKYDEQTKNSSIWTINADGSNPKQITFGKPNYRPAISPYGGKIVFVSERDGVPSLYLMNFDGSAERRVSPSIGAGTYNDPTWSYDGKRIACTRYLRGKWELCVMNPDGKNAQVVASTPRSFSGVAWSPNGKYLAIIDFTMNPQIPNSERSKIGFVDIQSRKQTIIYNAKDWFEDVSFSPDGTRLMFNFMSENTSIFTIKVDGSDMKQLMPGLSFRPSWGGAPPA